VEEAVGRLVLESILPGFSLQEDVREADVKTCLDWGTENGDIEKIVLLLSSQLRGDPLQTFLSLLSDSEIQIEDKEVVYSLYLHLYEHNKRFVQSAVGCLVYCCGEKGKQFIQYAINAKATNSCLIEGMLKVIDGENQ